uniref:Ribosomal protein S4 n=1 Tax=Zamia furfuracea TaxID=42329 RepID=A0A8H2SF55_ZAMFU|nr:ribosomal protein S4 [Zamia furfuracea]
MRLKRPIQRNTPASGSKTCRPLPGNVRNKKLTRIQRRIPRRSRSKRRSIKKNLYPRQNLNSYIKLQTIRKLPLSHGNLPIIEMHGGTERTSYIPFPLNPETRSDVIPVRPHFRETLPQARQPISHRKIRANNEMVNITRSKVSHGDPIPIKENYVRTMGRDIIKYSYTEISVNVIMRKFLDHPERMWRRTETKWFRLLKKRKGCRLPPKSWFSQQLRSSVQEKDLERENLSRSERVCLGSLFAEHSKMKRDLYHFKSLLLLKRRNGKNRDLPARTISLIVGNGNLYSNSTHCFESPYCNTKKRRIKGIKLPTHYSEVNHRTPKAVVSYGPDIGHIPYDMRSKDPNLPLRSRNERGQNM